jgi:hypothetical protein
VSQCSDELLELPVEELAAILRDEQLNVWNEEDVWHCALRWIDRDTENRKVHVLDLMKTVRLGLLDKNIFLKNVSNRLKTWMFMWCRAVRPNQFPDVSITNNGKILRLLASWCLSVRSMSAYKE